MGIICLLLFPYDLILKCKLHVHGPLVGWDERSFFLSVVIIVSYLPLSPSPALPLLPSASPSSNTYQHQGSLSPGLCPLTPALHPHLPPPPPFATVGHSDGTFQRRRTPAEALARAQRNKADQFLPGPEVVPARLAPRWRATRRREPFPFIPPRKSIQLASPWNAGKQNALETAEQ